MNDFKIVCGDGVEDGKQVFWCVKQNSLQMFVMPLDTTVDVLEDMLTDYAGVEDKKDINLTVGAYNTKRFEDIYYYIKGVKLNDN